ncbi:VacJ family lipoprotein [Noviherbaspirillum sp.]|jgi:phospholipid-binding lipoprotein MlaA|uniref:MlaA family lipoprotein n=1 Tax=Noviherbaspirillum sp. TaxID=1926288 RepID=UPI0025DBC2B2|nr:VacJ family lipoprotein [Noviherbaspirillum sp.]
MNPALRIIVLALSLVLAGCATTNRKDPLEGFNRAMFQFNDKVDQVALKPAAEAYSNLPTFVQTGVSNFFGNMGDVWTAINNFLQGKAADGLSDVMRVAVNSTMGLGGFLDIGSEAGLAKHKEDFGQTLGKWGVKSGPYVVLPLLGPSTLRDTIVLPIDYQADPWYYVYPVHVRNMGSVLRAVDQRAAVLDASNLIEEAALDRYVFVRDAYMQRRESKVRDGASPESHYEEDVGPTFTEQENAASPQNSSTLNVQSETSTEPSVKPVVEVEQNDIIKRDSMAAGKEIKQ